MHWRIYTLKYNEWRDDADFLFAVDTQVQQTELCCACKLGIIPFIRIATFACRFLFTIEIHLIVVRNNICELFIR